MRPLLSAAELSGHDKMARREGFEPSLSFHSRFWRPLPKPLGHRRIGNFGAARRVRTDDPLLTKQVLYQLS